MLARPALCDGGAGPGFRGDFSTSCPCCLSDKGSIPMEGQPARLMGADGEGRRAGFEGMTQGFVHCVEASPMGGSDRGDSAFRATGEESNSPSENSFF